ncbi:MAG: MFS transporter [Negativicutes bacterium]|jgi:PPP family 3-phenylpropionic acid transporter
MQQIKRLLNKFRLTVFLFWTFAASFNCYYVLFFESGKHITPSTIGIMMSLYTIATMVGQSFWGYLCDKFDSIKKAFVLAAVLSCIIIGTFPFNDSIVTLYIAMAALGFLMPPMSPMVDSWLLKHLSKVGQETKFGTVRAFGSLGWSLTACATAYMISWFGWNIMYFEGVVAALLMLVTVSFIDDVSLRSVVNPQAEQAKITPWKAARELLRDRAYLFIVVVLFFQFFGLQTAYNYLGLIMKNAGGDVINLGWTFFIDAGSELPSMFLSVWLLKRFPQKRIIMVAVSLYLLRFLLILYFQTATAVMLTSVLQGFAFGLLLTSVRNYIYLVAPSHLKTMAFTVGEAIYLNLAVIIGGIFGGLVVEFYGVYSLIMVCALSVCVALSLLFVNCFVLRKG